jgi:NAD(P)H-hydrate epimerase
MILLTTDQIRAWDAYTIQHEPISSTDLMARAAAAFTDWFIKLYPPARPIILFCGTGNNGGDGLAIARILHILTYDVSVYICRLSSHESPDFTINYERLPEKEKILRGSILEKELASHKLSAFKFPAHAVIIDAILGSGLTRPVIGFWAGIINRINQTGLEIVAVDIPSGLFSDQNMDGLAIKASRTFSFQIPKLAFLLAENYPYVGAFSFGSIGLLPQFLQTIKPENILLTKSYVQPLLKKRGKFDHKGSLGHALLVVGQTGMAGAAILATKACLRSGVGLVTVQTPQYNRQILQIAVPEAMVIADKGDDFLTEIVDTAKYAAVGCGCGIGTSLLTAAALMGLLQKTKKPIVLDADALNLLAENPNLWKWLPKGSILTPHPKEFERLFGTSENDYARLERLRKKAKELKIHILLKGAHTVIADTEGVCFFNSTGNAGIATGGSGDVLAGLITGLLAQGYEPKNAVLLGVYLHGMAGDLAAETWGQEAMIASDMADKIGQAFLALTAVKI